MKEPHGPKRTRQPCTGAFLGTGSSCSTPGERRVSQPTRHQGHLRKAVQPLEHTGPDQSHPALPEAPWRCAGPSSPQACPSTLFATCSLRWRRSAKRKLQNAEDYIKKPTENWDSRLCHVCRFHLSPRGRKRERRICLCAFQRDISISPANCPGISIMHANTLQEH